MDGGRRKGGPVEKPYKSAWKSQLLSGMMMPLMQFIGKDKCKERQFCTDKCRAAWWYANRSGKSRSGLLELRSSFWERWEQGSDVLLSPMLHLCPVRR
jgi:hypothetical protein